MATVEWTVLEKLLLSQAVYKYGEDNWFQIARNLKHHALLDRPSDYFNQKNCSLQYYLMVEDMDKQKRQQSVNQDMPVVVRIARDLYSLRLEELKKAISEDEEKFLTLVSEIDEIRAGKWDNQLLGLPETTTTPATETKEGEKQPEPPAAAAAAETAAEAPATTINVDETAALEKGETFEDASETLVQQEEEMKIEADNLEEEMRNIKETDTPLSATPSPQLPEPTEKSSLTPSETVSTLAEAAEKPSVEEDAAENNLSETAATADDKVEEEQTTHPLKRGADDTDVSEEPSLKRQRTEELPESATPEVPLENVEKTQAKDDEDEGLLTIDTTRTDYSTDVSQGTTPADTSDIVMRDGTESVAGSESNAATPTAERRRGQSIAGRDDQRHKSWLKNINLLWREIANHKNGAMFMNPIKEAIAPHYYDIVKRPMDLKTIKNRIRDGLINTTTEFERDVMLMLNNSLMYNKEGTEVYQMAREMLDDAVEQIKVFKTADTESSSTSSHTRAAAAMAAKERRKSVAVEQ